MPFLAVGGSHFWYFIYCCFFLFLVSGLPPWMLSSVCLVLIFFPVVWFYICCQFLLVCCCISSFNLSTFSILYLCCAYSLLYSFGTTWIHARILTSLRVLAFVIRFVFLCIYLDLFNLFIRYIFCVFLFSLLSTFFL